jgi:hypothetical protein
MNMRQLAISFVIAASLGLADSAEAQSGFSLKANSIFNRQPDAGESRVPTAAGLGVGAELVLPGGLGVGVSAYSGGPLNTLHRDASSTLVLGEANYFVPIPLIPIRPYAGVHAGLGSYRHSDLADAERPRFKDDVSQLGYQVGLRIRLGRTLALDGQLRRVSTWLSAEQGERFSREQVLIGITVF